MLAFVSTPCQPMPVRVRGATACAEAVIGSGYIGGGMERTALHNTELRITMSIGCLFGFAICRHWHMGHRGQGIGIGA